MSYRTITSRHKYRYAALAALLISSLLAQSLKAADGDAAAEAGEPLEISRIEKVSKFLGSCQGGLENPIELNSAKLSPQAEAWLKDLVREIIGQDDAVNAVVDAILRAMAGLNNPEQPLASFLFTGPTGVGKTELVRSLVRLLGGNPDYHLIRIDCGEQGDGSEVSGLIGATAKYVGYGDKVRLSKEELAKRALDLVLPDGTKIKINILLLDEIEKATDKLFNLLLGMLDNGKVTLGNNQEVYLRKAFLFGTSNLGADSVEALVNAKAAAIREKNQKELTLAEADLTGRYDKDLRAQIHEEQQAALARKFKPEFRNRWQEIIQFLHLGPQEFYTILDKKTAQVQIRVFERGNKKAGILLTENVRKRLVEVGTNIKDGARQLDKKINHFVLNPIARMISSGEVLEGDVVLVDVDAKGNWSYKAAARGLTRGQLLQFADVNYPGFKMLGVRFDKPVEDGETLAIEKADIVDLLNMDARGKEALKQVWMKSRNVPHQIMGLNDGQGQISQASVKYIYIDSRLVKLSMMASVVSAGWEAEISKPDLFPPEELNKWTEEEVRKILESVKVEEKK